MAFDGMERRIRWKTITERSAWMDNTSQHRSPMKNSFSVETIFLQNIIDLINWTLCTLNLSELPTRARHRHLREQTCFYTVSATDTMEGGLIKFWIFFSFFPLPFLAPPPRQAIRHDPATANPVELRNYRPAGHTLAPVVSGLFRFIGVCSFHREHRYYALEITRWCTMAVRIAGLLTLSFRKTNHRGSIETGLDRYRCVSMELWALRPPLGFYLFSRFISKIPSRRVYYTYNAGITFTRQPLHLLFGVDSRSNSRLSKVCAVRLEHSDLTRYYTSKLSIEVL